MSKMDVAIVISPLVRWGKHSLGQTSTELKSEVVPTEEDWFSVSDSNSDQRRQLYESENKKTRLHDPAWSQTC